MNGIFARKTVAQLVADANDTVGDGHVPLKRSLTATGLTALGIGAIIGAGIFSLTGTAAANYAGPGIVYSFVIGGILCAFAGLCYAEMAAMVPVSGSAYAYSYATLGELIAWIIGWDLILEYGFGAVVVSNAWTGYFMSLLHKTIGIEFPDIVWRLTAGPFETVAANGHQLPGLWNLPASFIALFLAAILYRGIKESAWVNTTIVVIKVTIVVIFIALGWAVIDHANWIGDPNAHGLLSLIPARALNPKGDMAYGWQGMVRGAGVVFFAYIGFDAVSTTAQECTNPKRDLPIGILASLGICTALYILMALVMTGVVPYLQLNVSDPVAVGIDHIVALRGWAIGAQKMFTLAVKVGALAGLTSVILVMMLGQTRVLYAMSRDGLLPWFRNTHKDFGTPHTATVVTGIFVAVFGGLLPMSLVGELVSIGTLLAFVLVCVGVIILRYKNPEAERPFKTPAPLVVGTLGALSCIYVMAYLPVDTWIRLLVWLIIGFVIYFTYGHKHSTLGNAPKQA